MGLQICISNKFSGNTDIPSLGSHYRNHWSRSSLSFQRWEACIIVTESYLTQPKELISARIIIARAESSGEGSQKIARRRASEEHLWNGVLNFIIKVVISFHIGFVSWGLHTWELEQKQTHMLSCHSLVSFSRSYEISLKLTTLSFLSNILQFKLFCFQVAENLTHTGLNNERGWPLWWNNPGKKLIFGRITFMGSNGITRIASTSFPQICSAFFHVGYLFRPFEGQYDWWQIQLNPRLKSRAWHMPLLAILRLIDSDWNICNPWKQLLWPGAYDVLSMWGSKVPRGKLEHCKQKRMERVMAYWMQK